MAYAKSLDRTGRAARIWGGAEWLREEIGAPISPVNRPRCERRVAGARAALGDDAAFDLARQEGRTMNLERVIKYALDAEESRS